MHVPEENEVPGSESERQRAASCSGWRACIAREKGFRALGLVTSLPVLAPANAP